MGRPQETLELLKVLAEAELDYVVIGGVAATVWGTTRPTDDLDIALRFDADQIARLLEALRPYRPRHATRMDLGEIRDPIDYLLGFRMLLIETDIGRLDALKNVTPVGDYERLASRAARFEIGGHMHRVIDIDDLIAVKDSLPRPRDADTAIELRAIRSKLDRA